MDTELRAIAAILRTIDDLPAPARSRVVAYVTSRYADAPAAGEGACRLSVTSPADGRPCPAWACAIGQGDDTVGLPCHFPVWREKRGQVWAVSGPVAAVVPVTVWVKPGERVAEVVAALEKWGYENYEVRRELP